MTRPAAAPLEPIAWMYWNEPDTQRHFSQLREPIGTYWQYVVPLYAAPSAAPSPAHAAEQPMERSEDARDAARYRWLRDHDDDEVVERTVRVSRQMAGYKWNDAIDAAIREQENHDAA